MENKTKLEIFNPKEMTVVYIRRKISIEIKTIVEFANSFYNIGCFDFILVDYCKDHFALDFLGKNGDPLRYFGTDSGVTVEEILSNYSNYSRFRNIVIFDQNDDS